MLGLEPSLKVNAQQELKVVIDDVWQQSSLPAEPCGRDGDARDRVARVVLAVAKGPLAVLP